MRHVLICGMLGGERGAGDAEVWAVNQAHENHPNPDRVYVFHPFCDFEQQDFVSRLDALGCPIYCRRVFRELPNSVEFPIEKVVKKLGVDYFTCSIAYMIAHALYEGVNKLTLTGMYDASDSTEYISHIPCVNFWVGRAMSCMNVVIGSGSMVAKPFPWQVPRYGYFQQKNECVANRFLSAAYIGAMNIPMEVIDGETGKDVGGLRMPIGGPRMPKVVSRT